MFRLLQFTLQDIFFPKITYEGLGSPRESRFAHTLGSSVNYGLTHVTEVVLSCTQQNSHLFFPYFLIHMVYYTWVKRLGVKQACWSLWTSIWNSSVQKRKKVASLSQLLTT